MAFHPQSRESVMAKKKSGKRSTPARPKGLVSKIKSLKDAVQDAIDNGATTVQQVHERIAAMPFDRLEKIAMLEGVVNKARGLSDQSIGAVYDAVRAINARVGELADAALSRMAFYNR